MSLNWNKWNKHVKINIKVRSNLTRSWSALELDLSFKIQILLIINLIFDLQISNILKKQWKKFLPEIRQILVSSKSAIKLSTYSLSNLNTN